MKAAFWIHAFDQDGWARCENCPGDVRPGSTVQDHLASVLSRQVDQEARIRAGIGSIEQNVRTTIEAYFAARDFEDDIVPLEMPGDVHSIAETVDPTLEPGDPRRRKFISPGARAHGRAIWQNCCIACTSHFRHEERGRVTDGRSTHRHSRRDQLRFLDWGAAYDFDGISIWQADTAIALFH